MTPLFNARRNGDDSLKTDGSLIIAEADSVSDNGCAPTREPKTFPVRPLQTDFERYGIEHVRPRFDPARLPPNGAPDGLVDLLVLWAGIGVPDALDGRNGWFCEMLYLRSVGTLPGALPKKRDRAVPIWVCISMSDVTLTLNKWNEAVERTYRALVVEDQTLMRLALMDQISTAFENAAVLGAQTLEIALYELANENFDLVIIDPGLPGFDPTSQDDRLSVVSRIIEASPTALHAVITGSDNTAEADQFRGLGAVAYLGKTGLEPGMLCDVLDDISTSGFSIRLSRVTMTVPDYCHSALTPREQEIINLMARREPGMSRIQIYEQVAGKLGIDRDSAEKYFKKARAKIMKSDHKLPVGI